MATRRTALSVSGAFGCDLENPGDKLCPAQTPAMGTVILVVAAMGIALGGGLLRHVSTRDQLLEEVWGHDVTVTTRTIDTHVKRLREKLGAAGAMIETVRGIGYRFCD